MQHAALYYHVMVLQCMPPLLRVNDAIIIYDKRCEGCGFSRMRLLLYYFASGQKQFESSNANIRWPYSSPWSSARALAAFVCPPGRREAQLAWLSS